MSIIEDTGHHLEQSSCWSVSYFITDSGLLRFCVEKLKLNQVFRENYLTRHVLLLAVQQYCC